MKCVNQTIPTDRRAQKFPFFLAEPAQILRAFNVNQCHRTAKCANKELKRHGKRYECTCSGFDTMDETTGECVFKRKFCLNHFCFTLK